MESLDFFPGIPGSGGLQDLDALAGVEYCDQKEPEVVFVFRGGF